MSLHTSGIYIKKLFNEDPSWLLRELGFSAPCYEGFVTEEDAWSVRLSGVAVGQAAGWTAAFNAEDMFGSGDLPELPDPIFRGLWDPSVDAKLRQLSINSEVFGFIAEGCTATYGFTWYVHGHLQRMHLWHHGTIKLNEGRPFAFEPVPLSGYLENEDTIFAIAKHLAIPLDTFEHAQFRRYSYSSPPGPKRETFFHRPLTEYEAAILQRLLETDFRGRNAIAEQLERTIVRQIDLKGTLEFHHHTLLEATAESHIPTAAEAEDVDGVKIHFLLHVAHGKAKKLEIHRGDRSPPRRLPSPEELRVFSPGGHMKE